MPWFLKTYLVATVLTFLPLVTMAGLVDMNVIYSSDSVKTATTATNTLTAYDFSVGIPIGKRDIFVSFAYGSFSSSQNPGTTASTWTGTDMGLRFSGFFGRGKLFCSSFTYNFKSTVKYKSDPSDVELRGTSMKLDIGMNYWFSENIALVAKLFYYAPTLGEEIDATTLNKVSYARTSMGQAIGLNWVF